MITELSQDVGAPCSCGEGMSPGAPAEDELVLRGKSFQHPRPDCTLSATHGAGMSTALGSQPTAPASINQPNLRACHPRAGPRGQTLQQGDCSSGFSILPLTHVCPRFPGEQQPSWGTRTEGSTPSGKAGWDPEHPTGSSGLRGADLRQGTWGLSQPRQGPPTAPMPTSRVPSFLSTAQL